MTGILLLDYDMPNMTGLELQKKLKQDNLSHSIKIIFITAVIDTVHQEAIENGALRVFEKPFDPKELIEYLDKVK